MRAHYLRFRRLTLGWEPGTGPMLFLLWGPPRDTRRLRLGRRYANVHRLSREINGRPV